MGPERIPKALMFGELHAGKRKQGGQRKRYKDVLKASLKSYGADPSSFESIVNNCTLWHTSCNNGLKIFKAARTARLPEQHRHRHAGDTVLAHSPHLIPNSAMAIVSVFVPHALG